MSSNGVVLHDLPRFPRPALVRPGHGAAVESGSSIGRVFYSIIRRPLSSISSSPTPTSHATDQFAVFNPPFTSFLFFLLPVL